MINLEIKTDVVLNDTKFREFRKFINSLRCPLCNSQLDGNLHPKESRLFCSQSTNEYVATFIPSMSEAYTENIIHIFDQFEYNVYSIRFKNLFQTNITRFRNDFIPRYKQESRKELLEVIGPRIQFFRKKMDEKTFLNKLKFYSLYN